MNYAEAFEGKLDIVVVAQLNLPTGGIVACDPFFAASATPFERSVAPGLVSVELLRTHSGEWGDRNALARLVVRAGHDTITYEPAVISGSDSNAYFVDSGLGAFMDESARAALAEAFAKYYAGNPRGNYYTDVLEAEFQKNAAHAEDRKEAGAWVVHRIPGTNLDAVMFATGLGDGRYESFWALGRDGKPNFLVTDLRMDIREVKAREG